MQEKKRRELSLLVLIILSMFEKLYIKLLLLHVVIIMEAEVKKSTKHNSLRFSLIFMNFICDLKSSVRIGHCIIPEFESLQKMKSFPFSLLRIAITRIAYRDNRPIT